jgi:hypothetical protein
VTVCSSVLIPLRQPNRRTVPMKLLQSRLFAAIFNP